MYSATSVVGLLGCVAARSEFTANNVRDKWVCTNNGNIDVSSTREALILTIFSLVEQEIYDA